MSSCPHANRTEASCGHRGRHERQCSVRIQGLEGRAALLVHRQAVRAGSMAASDPRHRAARPRSHGQESGRSRLLSLARQAQGEHLSSHRTSAGSSCGLGRAGGDARSMDRAEPRPLAVRHDDSQRRVDTLPQGHDRQRLGVEGVRLSTSRCRSVGLASRIAMERDRDSGSGGHQHHVPAASAEVSVRAELGSSDDRSLGRCDRAARSSSRARNLPWRYSSVEHGAVRSDDDRTARPSR